MLGTLLKLGRFEAEELFIFPLTILLQKEVFLSF